MKSISCKALLLDVSRENELESPTECMKKSKIIADLNQSSIHSMPEAAQIILVRLFHLLHNGDGFNSSEQVKLLCDISRLLIINNHHLKRIVYKILKVL